MPVRSPDGQAGVAAAPREPLPLAPRPGWAPATVRAMRSHELVAQQTWLLTELPRWLLAGMTAGLTPLAVRAAGAPRLVFATFLAGALAALGLALAPQPGLAAVLCTVPYAGVTAGAGLVGLGRVCVLPRPASRVVVAIGLVFLPAAATWLLAARAGVALLGYAPFWVLLTAAHFHVAGCYLLVVVGRAALERGVGPAAVAVGCAVSVPLTAAGIYGPRWLETGAALGMAACALGAGLVLWSTPRATPRRGLLRAAGAVLLATMPLAAAFALRDHGAAVSVLGLEPLASMLVSHGVPNALAFSTLALLALGLPRAAPGGARLGSAPPLSRLAGGWHIGARFLVDAGVAREVSPPPRGLVDDLDELAHPGLSPDHVAPAIRAFYQRTGEHEMIVLPSWRMGFRAAGRLWARLARRIGQLQLPVRAEPGGDALVSRIVAVDAVADGRRAPRSWIRTFPDGEALYVAVYSTHRRGDRAYMNIAFPLPGGNLTSILRMDHLGDGVTVSTRAGGDCGIYLALRLLGRTWALRLPMSETIEVWTADDRSAPEALRQWGRGWQLLARHRLWICGLPYLTLDYAMRRRAAQPSS